jgi:hypothetical protein
MSFMASIRHQFLGERATGQPAACEGDRCDDYQSVGIWRPRASPAYCAAPPRLLPGMDTSSERWLPNAGPFGLGCLDCPGGGSSCRDSQTLSSAPSRPANGTPENARTDVLARQQARDRVDTVHGGGRFEPTAHGCAAV